MVALVSEKIYLGSAKPGSGGGSAPVIDELNVTPSTSAQTITAPSGTDGYSPVNVAAVTSAIDANITAGNIKKDVSILGVTGSYEGQTPTGTMYIISNGTYNVADKAIANVQVPTTVPEIYRVFRINNGKLDNSISTAFMPLPSSVTDVGQFLLARCYYDTPSTTLSGSVDLSSLVSITNKEACYEMFYNCKGITSVDLSSLTTISNNAPCNSMFYNCEGITSADLSSLTTIGGTLSERCCYNMFYNCKSLTTVTLGALTTISAQSACAYMYAACTGLTTVSFNNLTNINARQCMEGMFSSCANLTSLSFPALTSSSFGTFKNQFNNLVQNVTGCTIHFPSNLDPAGGSTVISSLTGYPNFGGTNTVLAFDLPATE